MVLLPQTCLNIVCIMRPNFYMTSIKSAIDSGIFKNVTKFLDNLGNFNHFVAYFFCLPNSNLKDSLQNFSHYMQQSIYSYDIVDPHNLLPNAPTQESPTQKLPVPKTPCPKAPSSQTFFFFSNFFLFICESLQVRPQRSCINIHIISILDLKGTGW